MNNRFTILFCCQKSAINYMTKYKPVIKHIFEANVGRRYLVKVEITDNEIIKQYRQSSLGDSIYIIDVKNDILDTDTDIDKINLAHMGIIITETNPNAIIPTLNTYNIGVMCFMSCIHCNETGCPGKSSCGKLATDILRLWNTMRYNPKKLDDTKINKIQSGIQEMFYDSKNQLHKELPDFIKKNISEWKIE